MKTRWLLLQPDKDKTGNTGHFGLYATMKEAQLRADELTDLSLTWTPLGAVWLGRHDEKVKFWIYEVVERSTDENPD